MRPRGWDEKRGGTTRRAGNNTPLKARPSGVQCIAKPKLIREAARRAAARTRLVEQRHVGEVGGAAVGGGHRQRLAQQVRPQVGVRLAG